MASTNNVITDETTKTVAIRQEAYTLEQGTFRKGYHHHEGLPPHHLCDDCRREERVRESRMRPHGIHSQACC